MFSSTLRVAGQVARSSTVCARASTRVSLNARPVVTLVRGFASTTLARFGGGGGGYEGRAPARNGERWQERRPRAPRREPSTPTPSRVLYVGNLPYRATEEDLKELFGEAAVESVRMGTLIPLNLGCFLTSPFSYAARRSLQRLRTCDIPNSGSCEGGQRLCRP